MGQLFQVESWEKHPSRNHLFIMAKEIGKGFGKAQLLAFIYENKEK